jgi:hypothetical protein
MTTLREVVVRDPSNPQAAPHQRGWGYQPLIPSLTELLIA